MEHSNTEITGARLFELAKHSRDFDKMFWERYCVGPYDPYAKGVLLPPDIFWPPPMMCEICEIRPAKKWGDGWVACSLPMCRRKRKNLLQKKRDEKRRADPVFRLQRSTERKDRYKNDSGYRAQVLERSKAYHAKHPDSLLRSRAKRKSRLENDPVYREQQSEYYKDMYRKRCAMDPDYKKNRNAKQRQRRLEKMADLLVKCGHFSVPNMSPVYKHNMDEFHLAHRIPKSRLDDMGCPAKYRDAIENMFLMSAGCNMSCGTSRLSTVLRDREKPDEAIDWVIKLEDEAMAYLRKHWNPDLKWSDIWPNEAD